MTDFDVKISPDNWKIYIKIFISSLLTLLRAEELQRAVSLQDGAGEPKNLCFIIKFIVACEGRL